MTTINKPKTINETMEPLLADIDTSLNKIRLSLSIIKSIKTYQELLDYNTQFKLDDNDYLKIKPYTDSPFNLSLIKKNL
jgi:hypothetical protein